MTAKILSEDNHPVLMIRPDADAHDLKSEIENRLAQAKAIADVLTEASEDKPTRYTAWCLADSLDALIALIYASWKADKPETPQIEPDASEREIEATMTAREVAEDLRGALVHLEAFLDSPEAKAALRQSASRAAMLQEAGNA